MRDLKKQLNAIKHDNVSINPDAHFVRDAKQALMHRIESSRVQKEHIDVIAKKSTLNLKDLISLFSARSFAKVLRPVVTVAVALFLTTGGWIASAYAEPGDALWTAKAAVGSVIERGQLALADDTHDVTLNLNFAAKRAQVIKNITARDDVTIEKKHKIIKENAEDIEHNIASVEEKLDTVDVLKNLDLVKDVSLKTKEIVSTFQETAVQVRQQHEGVEVDEVLAKDLDNKVDSSSKKSLQIVEKVLQKKADAEQEISEEEKIIIKDHIDSVVQNIKKEATRAKEQADSLVTSVQKQFDDEQKTQASGMLNTSTPDIASSSTPSVETAISTSSAITTNTKTNDLNSTTTTISTQTMANASSTMQVRGVQQRANETVQNFEEQKNQVNQLVDIDIVEAVKKTRILSETVSQTAQDVTTATEELLPYIQNSGEREDEVTSTKIDETILKR